MHICRRLIAVAGFALLHVLAISGFAQPPEWQLVWSDEFDGTEIDTSKWSHEVNANGGGNNELQYYTARPENSFVEDGKLVIRAIKETFTGPHGTRDYTSARMRTLNKGDWKYGRIEVRAKTPSGQGLWPAIWMLPTDWVYGGWAASGEIDIMELRGDDPNKVLGTLHYGGEWPQNTHSGDEFRGPDFSAGFHTFAIEWEEGVFRWYVDGEHYQTQTSWWSTGGEYPAPFNQRFHLLLNVAVGGNFLDNPPPNADYFPQQMEVDWVRVYQRGEREPFNGSPIALPAKIEAENYDVGSSGIVYSDTTAENQGGEYRQDQVDIEVCTDEGGGFNVGWVALGEWLEYTITADREINVKIECRVASDNNGGTMQLRLQDLNEDLVDSINVPHTAGWQNWTSVTTAPVTIPAGEHRLRVEFTSGEFNLNYLDIQSASSVGSAFFIY